MREHEGDSGLGRTTVDALPMQLATTPLKQSAAKDRMPARRLEKASSASSSRLESGLSMRGQVRGSCCTHPGRQEESVLGSTAESAGADIDGVVGRGIRSR